MAFDELTVVLCPGKKHHKDKNNSPNTFCCCSNFCKAASRSPSGLNELPEVHLEFPFNLISQLNDGFLNRLIRACTQNSKHRLGPRTQTTSSPPFFLRDSRANETRARVKIIARKKRRHAAGREKNFSLSPPRVVFSRVG